MSNCCDPVAYRKMFNTKDANRRLARYRRKGLEPLIGGIVEWLTSRGIDNSTVLEIGGGVGGVQVELLKAGASNATNVEMSAAYAPAFTSLAAENGFEMRMRQLFGDFVEVQDGIEPAGIVILNKVICCYPYMERMMAAATSKTQRHLGMVFPRDRLAARIGVGWGNGYLALRGCDFRGYVHHTDEIQEIAHSQGLRTVHRAQTFTWQAELFERAS